MGCVRGWLQGPLLRGVGRGVSEYTPTTENVRSVFAHGGAGQSTDRRRAMFDRWLAAHDAEVRAGVGTEEPEWEYGVVRHDGVMVNNGDYQVQQTHRRRKAGPWVPVES